MDTGRHPIVGKCLFHIQFFDEDWCELENLSKSNQTLQKVCETLATWRSVRVGSIGLERCVVPQLALAAYVGIEVSHVY